MDSAQKDLFLDLSQSEKLSEIKPPLSCYLIELSLLISLRDILMCMLKGFPQDLFLNTLFTRLRPGLRNSSKRFVYFQSFVVVVFSHALLQIFLTELIERVKNCIPLRKLAKENPTESSRKNN